MPDILLRPYFLNTSVLYRLRIAILFGLFVFLFLVIFQPFRIFELGQGLVWASAGFGLVTAVTMILLNIVPLRLLPAFFDEERWSIGRELSITLLNLFFIGLFNFLFFGCLVQDAFTLRNLIWFQLVTMAVGIFPVSAAILISESIRRKKFSTEAKQLSGTVGMQVNSEERNNSQKDVAGQHLTAITIPSQNKDEAELTLFAQDILFIRAADNYAEVYFVREEPVRTVVRNSLKALEQVLEPFSEFVRCHKSYIVNTGKVARVSGNAQGYLLHINGSNFTIPVSRQLNAEVKTWFTRTS